jgi:hypothetical protein
MLPLKRMQTWRFYFLPRFGCGARWESAEPATLRAGLPELGLRRILDAVLATGALVFLPAAIAILLLLVSSLFTLQSARS